MTQEQIDKAREYTRRYQKKWYVKNRARVITASRKRRELNRETYLAESKVYYQKNKEKIKARAKAWDKNNKDRIRARLKTKMSENLNFRIACRLRKRIGQAVKRQYGSKASGTIEILGCSIESFRIYIESKFEPGMTWDNIHLDHIIPCALFDLRKPEHQKRCFHFSNYQPLLAFDNISKGKRIFSSPETLPL